jgi:glutathione S-transferase
MQAVTLRYFSIVGRAQPIRHALADGGVVFEDVRIGLGDWPTHRENAAFAGTFAALPTLTWGAETVSETLPIGSYVARKLGHYDGLEPGAVARLESIASCAYLDVAARFGEVIWVDRMYPGVDIVAAFPFLMGRVFGKLDFIERVLPDSTWLGGERPVVADFFSAEAFETVRHVLGPRHDDALAKRLPRFTALARRVRERPSLASSWEKRAATFTARPDEPAIIERLRTAPLTI